ncbi:hypothetical protein D3C78_1463090 [compost metagenome]
MRTLPCSSPICEGAGAVCFCVAAGLAVPVFFAVEVFTVFARSWVMARAGLSLRRPWNTAWRTEPSLVISAKATSANSLGWSQCTSLASDPPGGLTTGGFFTCNGLSCSWRLRSVASLNPVPTLPA